MFHGSPFEATIVNKRIQGHGKYTFQNGNVYVGEMKDGHFHGKGTIFFVDGGHLEAEWKDGIATNEKLVFADGLEYAEKDWDYCTSQDRRFYQERVGGFVPGDPQLSNNPNDAPSIPLNTQDLGYCYASQEQVHWFDGTRMRSLLEQEKEWILGRK